MAEILKGAPVAKAISEKLTIQVEELKQKGIIPKLAIFRIGEKEDDIAYEKGAIKRCNEIGIEVEKFVLAEDSTKEEIISVIEKINRDDGIHGCLVFRPFKDKQIEAEVSKMLNPKKDVDCMTAGSLATVFSGNGEGYPPCTAKAVIELLDYYGYELSGKKVAVVGRSMVIGKPVSIMLQEKNSTVTMCHTKTNDLPNECKKAQIIVSCAGKAKVIDDRFIGHDQVVIDVGINIDDDGHLCGDVDFNKVEPNVAAITPVPAGVGSITTAVLASHVVEAASA